MAEERDFQPIPIGFNEVYTKPMWGLEFIATVELKGSEEEPARVEIHADTGSGMKMIAVREVRAWEIFSFNYTLGEGFFSTMVVPISGQSTLSSVIAAYPQ